jgi:hypothetical protein
LELEATGPKVMVDALDEGEMDRLRDWIVWQPRLFELLERALEIAEAA